VGWHADEGYKEHISVSSGSNGVLRVPGGKDQETAAVWRSGDAHSAIPVSFVALALSLEHVQSKRREISCPWWSCGATGYKIMLNIYHGSTLREQVAHR